MDFSELGIRSREDVAGMLPGVIETALLSYEQFVTLRTGGALEDPKGFKVHQDACKVAVGHLNAILKVVDWVLSGAEVSDVVASVDPDMLRGLAESRRAVEAFEGRTRALLSDEVDAQVDAQVDEGCV